VGGLSVLREVRRLLPHEDLIYVADSAHCPYGGKPQPEIKRRAQAITTFLVHEQGAKQVVVACNTATVAAVEELRATFEQPIVGMEPAVKPAAAATRNGVVGVLATGVTLAGSRFARLVERFGEGVEIITQPCPGLVELVEAGDLRGQRTRDLVRAYVDALLARGADTLVLGCTHYPFLRELIAQVAGPDVALIDPGPAVARQVARVLEDNNLLDPGPGTTCFFTTRSDAQEVIERLWGEPVGVSVIRV
jgi:glutamate racemase